MAIGAVSSSSLVPGQSCYLSAIAFSLRAGSSNQLSLVCTLLIETVGLSQSGTAPNAQTLLTPLVTTFSSPQFGRTFWPYCLLIVPLICLAPLAGHTLLSFLRFTILWLLYHQHKPDGPFAFVLTGRERARLQMSYVFNRADGVKVKIRTVDVFSVCVCHLTLPVDCVCVAIFCYRRVSWKYESRRVELLLPLVRLI